MRRIFDKWEKVSIRYKLFSITSGLLIGLAMVIYMVLYLSLPSYYHGYKISNLQNIVVELAENSRHNSVEHLIQNLKDISREHNINFVLRDPKGRIIYGKNQFYILFGSEKNKLEKNAEEYETNILLNTNESEHPYRLNIIMPLQPIDEANEVIRKIMPLILLLSLGIAIIGAYIYSKVITKPLIDIIESEREEENRRKDFIATISHELKTPITIISGQLEGMMYNIGKYKDRDTYLQKSYESTQELKDLVNEMMEMSKSDILESNLSISNVDLSELLHKLVERQRFLIEEKKLCTEVNIENNIEIAGDEEKLTKAINNIINNAIKYSPQNENLVVRLYREKNIKIPRRNIKSKIYFEVENTGVRIEKKYLDEIFNPFFRIEKSRSRKTGGSGLGLYIVSNILKAHGYEFSIKNKSNSVIFTIII